MEPIIILLALLPLAIFSTAITVLCMVRRERATDAGLPSWPRHTLQHLELWVSPDGEGWMWIQEANRGRVPQGWAQVEHGREGPSFS